MLLLLAVHPVTQAVPDVQQGLSVFWDAWAAGGAGPKALLAQAALPAARQALRRSGSKAEAPHLLKYVLQLLCSSGGDSEEDEEQDAAGGCLVGATHYSKHAAKVAFLHFNSKTSSVTRPPW